jgi:hypothetical protein
LRYPQAAVVELLDHMGNRIAHFRRRGFWRKIGAVFPRGIDNLLKLLGHWIALVR